MSLVRLALVGAHGTGKTTLARALAARLAEHGVSAISLPEVPRIICNSSGDPEFFRRGKNSPLKQCLILLGQVVYEAESMISGASVIIGDRSLLDHWAYTIYLFRGQFEDEHICSSFVTMVKKHCSSYDLLFYVPIEFGPVDDGTREDDAEFQREIDRIMLNLLDESGLNYSRVAGSVQERADLCFGQIMAKLKSSANHKSEG